MKKKNTTLTNVTSAGYPIFHAAGAGGSPSYPTIATGPGLVSAYPQAPGSYSTNTASSYGQPMAIPGPLTSPNAATAPPAPIVTPMAPYR